MSADTDGWIFKIEIEHPVELDDLLDAAAYAKHTA
jgi:glycine cleavage system H lipoate-binding protein